MPSVVHPTLLYINSEVVIPAKAGIQRRNTGFRVKLGMTIKVKRLMRHSTRYYVLCGDVVNTFLVRAAGGRTAGYRAWKTGRSLRLAHARLTAKCG